MSFIIIPSGGNFAVTSSDISGVLSISGGLTIITIIDKSLNEEH